MKELLFSILPSLPRRVRRFVVRRFEVRRLPELRRRVAAAFLAARLRLAALRLRVAAALRAAAERFAAVERDLVGRRREELVAFLADRDLADALRRRVRHAFLAAALRAALVPRRAVGLRVDRVVFFLVRVRVFRAILVFLLDFEDPVFDFPFGGFTRTRVPSAIEYGCKMSRILRA